MQQIKLFLVTRYNLYENGSASKVVAVSSDDSNFLNNIDIIFKHWFKDLDDHERVKYQEITHEIEDGSADAKCSEFVETKIYDFFKPLK